jgi:sugar lactone lactonase YvrE
MVNIRLGSMVIGVILAVTALTPLVSAGSITNTTTSGVPSPLGITFDSSNNIYVASDAGKVIRIAAGQTGAVDYAITGGSARGLAFDSSSNLYVANFGSGTVQRIAAAQTGVVDHVTGITQPYGVAFDSTGDMYVTSTNFGNATGGKVLKIANGQTGAVDYVTGLNTPTHLAFDSTGNLYISSYNGNKIYRVAAAQTGSVDYVTGLPITPIGITVDSAGTLFVGGFGNGGARVMRVMSGQTSPIAMAIALGTTDIAGIVKGSDAKLYVARYTSNAIATVDESPIVTLSGATSVTLNV